MMGPIRALPLVLALLGMPEAFAQEGIFFGDDAVTIGWPADVPSRACPPALEARAGSPCRLVGADGSLGAVFMTDHPGYALGTAAALERHLADSKEALADIARIHVMQTRVVRTDPLVGMMEILRNDGTLRELPAFEGSAVRQSSLLIPTGDRLVQVFVYLPENDAAADVYEPLLLGLQSGIAVRVPPVAPAEPAPTPDSPGIASLLPRALFWGVLIAAVIILCLSIARRLRRRD